MADLPPAPSSVRIGQIALCAPDIWEEEKKVVAQLGIAGVHRDPANVFQMRNTVFAAGNTFLEILQPVAPTAPSARFLDKHGGPGGYMLIMQVDDLPAAKARVEAMGIRIVHETEPAKRHGVNVSSLHLHPSDTGGTLMEINQMDPSDGWAWAGYVWADHQHTDIVSHIVAADLSSATPDALAERFATMVGRKVTAERTVELDGGVVRIVEGPSGSRDQLVAVDMLATDRDRAGDVVVIAGTPIRLV